MNFIGNFFLFPVVKKLENRFRFDEVTTIEFSGTLFWNTVYTKVQYGAVLLEKTDNI